MRTLAAALSLSALAPAAQAQPLRSPSSGTYHLDFEGAGDTLGPEWSRRRLSPTGAARLDAARPHGGARSLRLSVAGDNEWVSVDRAFAPDAFRDAAAVRLTGWIRTDGVVDASAFPGIAGLRLMLVDGYSAAERPRQPVLFENMSTTSDLVGPKGTTGWQRFEIVLPVPYDLAEVRVGANLSGRGAAWFDDLRLEALPASALPAASPAALAYASAALDTMQAYAVRRAEIDWTVFRAFTRRARRIRRCAGPCSCSTPTATSFRASGCGRTTAARRTRSRRRAPSGPRAWGRTWAT